MSVSAGELVLERFGDDGVFPNSARPVLIYRTAVTGTVTPEGIEALFAGNGWPPQWRSTIYTYHHYHSTTHEALGVSAGTARVMLGGPHGREFDLSPGDVVVIPAGVAHRRLSATADFEVVGAYPHGAMQWDVLKGEQGERPKADENIAHIAMPQRDPVRGRDGGLLTAWT